MIALLGRAICRDAGKAGKRAERWESPRARSAKIAADSLFIGAVFAFVGFVSARNGRKCARFAAFYRLQHHRGSVLDLDPVVFGALQFGLVAQAVLEGKLLKVEFLKEGDGLVFDKARPVLALGLFRLYRLFPGLGMRILFGHGFPILSQKRWTPCYRKTAAGARKVW